MQSVPELVEPAETISSEAHLSKAISQIKSSSVHALVVLNSDEGIAGVIDSRCLLDFQQNADFTKCKTVAVKTPVVSEKTTPEELVTYFLSSEARVLPYFVKGALKGVVTRTAALKLISGSSAVREAKVGEFMSRTPAMVGEGTSIQSARKKMRELGVYHLAITDKSGKLTGVISS